MKKAFLLFTVLSFLFTGCKEEEEECDCFKYNDTVLSGTSWERFSYGQITEDDAETETNVGVDDIGKKSMLEERLVFGNPNYIYTSKLYVSEDTGESEDEIEFGEEELRNDDFGFGGTYTYNYLVLTLLSANKDSVLVGTLAPDSTSLIFVSGEETLIFTKQ